MAGEVGDNGSVSPLLTTSPSRLHQSASRLQLPGLIGVSGNNDDRDGDESTTAANRQLFSALDLEPTSAEKESREKLSLRNMITSQGKSGFVEQVTRALVAALGLPEITLNATNPGIFNELPTNQMPKLKRGIGKYYSEEIERRCLFYPEYIGNSRPRQWIVSKRFEFLMSNPMCPDKSSDDVELLKNTLSQLKTLAENVIKSTKENSERQGMQRKKWDTVIPWLRFIMCFTDDKVKEKFLQRHNSLNREELDARGTLAEPTDYRHCVADLFNNSEVVFTVKAMPEVHPSFSEDMECPLTVPLIDVVEVGKRLQSMKVHLNNMKVQWERSGSGSYMLLSADDDDYRTEDDIYQFVDGDDRQSFLGHAQNKTFILFWWDIAYKHQLLSSALELLDGDVGGDGESIPSARTRKSYKKKGEAGMELFQENHLVGMDDMAQQMIAMVELKTHDNLQCKIKDVTNQMQKNRENKTTNASEILKMKVKLIEEFQVEDFF